jgi:hypothetical protein
MKKKENKVDGIVILNEDGTTKTTYKNVDEMWDDLKKDFKTNHPFSYWFDGVFEDVDFFGYAPHVILTEPLKVIHAGMLRIKWAYQRVYRGFDDRATWGVSYWLNDLMPKILREMKGSEVGIPMSFFDEECDKNGRYTEEQELKASQKYDKVISDLIWAFEEMKRLDDYEFDYKNKTPKQNMREYQKMIKDAKRKMELLITYYHEIGD